jgi:hypothetical protein
LLLQLPGFRYNANSTAQIAFTQFSDSTYGMYANYNGVGMSCYYGLNANTWNLLLNALDAPAPPTRD